TYQAVVICSMSINPGVRLVNNPRYPAIAEDYARTFRTLEGLRGDVFLGAHASLYDAAAKAQRLRAGERPNPFVDSAGYRRGVQEARGPFEEQLAPVKAEAGATPPAAGRGLAGVPVPVRPRGPFVPEAGVPPGNVTVLGASKGGWLTLLTAADLGQDEVRYAVLPGCGRDTVDLGPRLRGRTLSVYDEKDRFRPSCEATFEQAPRLRGRKELVVHTGLDHGLLYTPRPEWLDPVTEWI